MPVVVVCPGCGKRVKVPDGRQGTAGRCPGCGAAITFTAAGGMAVAEARRSAELSLGDRATRAAGSGAVDPGGLPEGATVSGRYTLGPRLGRGGMGVVYRAEDSRPRRPVALKFLATPGGAEDTAVARFLQEAETIARLNHHHIIQVYEVGEWANDGRALRFIAMELVEGGSLRDLVRERGRLPVAEASALMQQVGQALSHAHRQGVIHRDLKPANVLLTKDGVPKLADFGLAKGATASELSVAGRAMGTLGFMSPEQRQDAKSVDHRTDIYAWGATFYQLVTGKDPLAWDPDEIPHEVSAVIRKCLRDREGRYFSMDEALRALEEAQGAPVAARRPAAGKGPAAAGVCPQCEYRNAPDARFCQGCGAGLYAKCPACGKETRAGVKFCASCGVDVEKHDKPFREVREIEAALAASVHSAPPPPSDRRHTTSDAPTLPEAADRAEFGIPPPTSGETGHMPTHRRRRRKLLLLLFGLSVAGAGALYWFLLRDESYRSLRHSSTVWGVAFSPDGRTLATASEDGLLLWDWRAEVHRVLSRLPPVGNDDPWVCVAFPPGSDSFLVARSARGQVVLYTLGSGAIAGTGREPYVVLQQATGDYNPRSALSFSSDGKYVASSGEEGVTVWQAKQSPRSS